MRFRLRPGFYLAFAFLTVLVLVPCRDVAASTASQNEDPPSAAQKQASDIRVIALLADGIGDSYFKAVEILKSYGCAITTVGMTRVCSSCPNKKPRPVTADYLLADFEDLEKYDVVFIASGAQHRILSKSEKALEFIRSAHEKGLIIASLCAGNLVIVHSGIIRGLAVADVPYTRAATVAANGIIENAKVVSSGNVITAGPGGGRQGGGYLRAPIEELCIAVVRAVLGISYINEVEIETISEDKKDLSIRVKVLNPSDTRFLEAMPKSVKVPESIMELESIKAIAAIYRITDKGYHLVEKVVLSDNDGDGSHEGALPALKEKTHLCVIGAGNPDGIVEVMSR